MKRVILSLLMIIIMSSVQAAEKPWYQKFAEWFECTWLGEQMIETECRRSNYYQTQFFNSKTFKCYHRKWHGYK